MTGPEAAQPQNEPAARSDGSSGTTPEPAEGHPDRWRQVFPRRGVGISPELGAFALIAVIVGAFCLLAVAPRPHERLAAPSTRPDPVPGERLITRFPPACGLSTATINALVPEGNLARSGDFGSCGWYGRKPGTTQQRRLGIEITIWPGPAGELQPVSFNPDARTFIRTTPTSNAISYLGGIRAQNTTLKNVVGLGDDAFAAIVPLYADLAEAKVYFRVANAVATVSYRDDTLRSKNAPAQQQAFEKAFKAAAETAQSLGAPAAVPRFGAEERVPIIHRLPEPCTTVPAATVNKLAKGATSRTHQINPGTEQTVSAACSWRSERRVLMVTMLSEMDSAPGGPIRAATREYLRRHYDARAAQPISAHGQRYFHALTELGDQAFGAWAEETTPGRVVFRVRNVLVEVVYFDLAGTGKDTGPPLTQDQAVRGAYAAAVQVSKALLK